MPDDNDFLEKLPEDIEEIEKDPILKPLLDFREGTEYLKRNNDSEAEYLHNAEEKLKKLLETGIFDESPIARPYKDILDIYNRLFLNLKQYAEKADKALYRIKVMKDKYYITKAMHQKILYESQSFEQPRIQIKTNVDKDLEEFDKIVEQEKKSIKEKKNSHKNPWLQYRMKIQSENPHMKSSEVSKLASQTYKK